MPEPHPGQPLVAIRPPLRHLVRASEGATVTEYALLLAGVALVGLLAVRTLGGTTNGLLASASEAIRGTTATAGSGSGSSAAGAPSGSGASGGATSEATTSAATTDAATEAAMSAARAGNTGGPPRNNGNNGNAYGLANGNNGHGG